MPRCQGCSRSYLCGWQAMTGPYLLEFGEEITAMPSIVRKNYGCNYSEYYYKQDGVGLLQPDEYRYVLVTRDVPINR